MPSKKLPITQLQILKELSEYFTEYPDARFCQALQHLQINENIKVPSTGGLCIKDNYYISDEEILGRIKSKKEDINIKKSKHKNE